tara:strand:+ start:96 stop:611 length:516 start_codon:yes stop_codon:yes gene_type:complete
MIPACNSTTSPIAPTAEENAPTCDTGDFIADMLSSLMLENKEMKKSVDEGKQMINMMQSINSKMEAEFGTGVAAPPPSPETTKGKRTRSDLSELDTAQHQNKQAQSEAVDVAGLSTVDLLRRVAQERRVREEYALQVEANSVEIAKLQEQHRQLMATLRELKARVAEGARG